MYCLSIAREKISIRGGYNGNIKARDALVFVLPQRPTLFVAKSGCNVRAGDEGASMKALYFYIHLNPRKILLRLPIASTGASNVL